MSQPRLSICIPTYNRAKYLPELLDSIISQAPIDGTLEICISDNASTDNTKELVADYKTKFPYIVYHVNSENLGADRNFLKCVEIASGEYCWLMGSDDIVLKNAISYLFKIFSDCSIQKKEVAGFSLNGYMYNNNLSKRAEHTLVSQKKFNENSFIYGENIYIKLADYWGFISSLIINRKIWNLVLSKGISKKMFNAYVHIYIAGEMSKKIPCWMYISEPCVGWRSGNDSFRKNGLLERAKIDIYGYEFIARHLFGHKSLTYRKHINVIINRFMKQYLLSIKVNEPQSEFKFMFVCIKTYWHFPVFWLRVFPLLFVPTKIIPSFILKKLRDYYKNSMFKIIVEKE